MFSIRGRDKYPFGFVVDVCLESQWLIMMDYLVMVYSGL